MKSPAFRFGTKRYVSPLTPAQIQQEVQQITTGRKWFRNPLATVKEPFEGEVHASTFDLNYRALRRSGRGYPKITGRFTLIDAGSTEVELTLAKTGKEWALSILMVFALLLMLGIAVTMHVYPLLGFATALGIALALRRLPDQHTAATIFDLLQHRLHLTLIPDSSPD